MKLIARYKSRIIDSDNHAHLNMLIENYRHVGYLNELEPDKEYSIEIKLVKSKRSLQQNKYMWSLIRELALKTREIDLDLYIKLLDSTNAKFTYMVTVDNAVDILKSSFRIVKKMEKRDIVNNETNKTTQGWMYKCYFGTSKFTIEEMNHLLDTLITWCINEGIETDERFYD